MIIALIPNAAFDKSKHLAQGIVSFLAEHGITVVAEDDEAKTLGAKPISSVSASDINFFISMGGDGSILRLVHKYENYNPAVIGINLGHLGFMADIPLSDMYPSLQDLIDGKFEIEERLMLEGMNPHQESCLALNDIVLHRGPNPSLIELAIYVDDHYLNTFVADGMIVATPNGSTAYSLAAGGPILSPNLEAVVLTPISPHTISNRPIVLTADQQIRIQNLSECSPIEVNADGVVSQTLKTGESFHIRRSKKKFRIVNLQRRDYFSTLRTKLSWTGKLR